MKKKFSKKEWILLLFIVAIIGIGVVQYQYAKIGLYLAQVQFNQQVNHATQAIHKQLDHENQLTFLIKAAITENPGNFKASVDTLKDASSHYLQDFLKAEIVANGVNAPFSYHLYDDSGKQLLQSNNFKDQDSISIKKTIPIEGYLAQEYSSPLYLQLNFTNLNGYFIQQLQGLFIPGILFTIIVIGVAIWVFRRYYYQEKVITTTNDFINNLTHEMKTPVFSTGLGLKILENSTEKNTETVVQHLKAQNERLKELVENILDLAEMEQKGTFFQLEKIDFLPRLQQICGRYTNQSKVEKFHFSAEIEVENCFLYADEKNLENALVNIIENAIKYANQPEIALTLNWKSPYYVFTIRDNGPGIPQEWQNKIFQKYFRGNHGDTHNVKGYGLGLYYVKQVLKAHKGKISLTSSSKNGSIFEITLPKSM